MNRAILAIAVVAAAGWVCQGRIITVDDDGPADFSTIQAAIDDANDGDTVEVQCGTYREDINLLGKNIILKSTDPTDSSTVRATIIDGYVVFRGTEEPNCILTGFSIDGGISGFDWLIDPTGENRTHATISHCILESIVTGCGYLVSACDGTISNCIFANIYYVCCAVDVPQIVECHGLIENCTMWEMHDGIEVWAGGTTTLRNCILPDSSWFFLRVRSGATLNVSFCNVNGEPRILGDGTVNWGPGNFEGDPCFAEVGVSDYHLKSQAGRWDANEGRWTTDEVTSPCIDAGDPMSPIGWEPFPNGGIVNMGAYGGTAEASKSYFGGPPCEIVVAGDINGDCNVNFLDFRLMALHWMEDH